VERETVTSRALALSEESLETTSWTSLEVTIADDFGGFQSEKDGGRMERGFFFFYRENLGLEVYCFYSLLFLCSLWVQLERDDAKAYFIFYGGGRTHWRSEGHLRNCIVISLMYFFLDWFADGFVIVNGFHLGSAQATSILTNTLTIEWVWWQ
jgi:hypothetical protein